MNIPDVLYHYTSQKGFLGIIQTGKLWMTNILYMNDSSEFHHTYSMVRDEIKNRKMKIFDTIVDDKTDEYLDMEQKKVDIYTHIETILDGLIDEREIENYVFSLSNKKDDLNQWRGYCPKEGGFCVGFETSKMIKNLNIKNKSESRHYMITPCIYDTDKKRTTISKLCDPLEKLLTSDKRKKIDTLSRFISQMIHLSTYIKDDSFQSEEEYRLVFYGMSDEKKYREGRSMIIPYIEGQFVDENGRLPISKVIVGPTEHMRLSVSSVRKLLLSHEYEIEVTPSTIPYRPL